MKTLLYCAGAAFIATTVWTILSLGLTSSLSWLRPFSAAQIYGGTMATMLELIREREGAVAPGSAIPPLGRDSASAIGALSRKALLAEPLSLEPFRQLGRVERHLNNKQASLDKFSEAYRRDFRNLDIVLELFQDSVSKDKFLESIEFADSLLRGRPELLKGIFPFFKTLIDRESSRRMLARKLQSRPPWRSDFMIEYGSAPENEKSFIQLYYSLRTLGDVVPNEELGPCLFALVSHNRIDEAISLWYGQFNDDDVGKMPLLFNGNFSLNTNDSPFNWSILSTPGTFVRTIREPASDGHRGLNLIFTGSRGEFPTISQRLILTPGIYRLSGTFKSDEFRSTAGLRWRIYCSGAVIAETSEIFAVQTSGHHFELKFRVGTDKCASQVLQLESMAAVPTGQISSGSVWFTDMSIASEK